MLRCLFDWGEGCTQESGEPGRSTALLYSLFLCSKASFPSHLSLFVGTFVGLETLRKPLKQTGRRKNEKHAFRPCVREVMGVDIDLIYILL